MNFKKKIAVVLVTYNRLSLLKECVFALQKQTHKVDKIFIINNNSTDGTENWLNKQKDIYVIHQENLGGAGGFHTGFKIAFEQNFDFIWVMDDDVEPEIDCLEKLMLAFFQYGKDYSVLLPDRFSDVNREKRWRYGTKFNFKNPLYNLGSGNGICFSDDINKNILPIVAFPLEGPIFKREVIEKIGFVQKELFIIHDDTDYSIRTINANFRIGVVVDALLYKKIFVNSKKGLKVDFKLYYLVRNSIILDRKYGTLFFALIRNIIFNLKLVMIFIYYDFKTIDFQCFKAIKIIYKGIIDGFNWKL